MNDMMMHGLTLMGMGMGVVFVVLGAIYTGIVALGWMDAKWPEPKKEYDLGSPRPAASPAQSGPTDEERAAIKAALAHHTGMSPDEFDVRFR